MTPVKDGKADFIRLHCDRERNHCNGYLTGRENQGSTPEKLGMGNWEFIAKSQGIGDQWTENY